MSHSQAEILIIQNIQLLEQSRELLENTVEKKFFDTIDQIIKNHTQSSDEDFIGVYDFYEDETWFLPNVWSLESFDIENSKTHKNVYAYYELIHEGNNDTNYWRLSNYFSNEYDKAVFNFTFWKNSFSNYSKAAFKLFCSEQNNKFIELKKLGFQFNLDGQNWYLPIPFLNQEDVIQNYQNDTLEDALAPIKSTLDILIQAHPIFNEIVQSAKIQFSQHTEIL
ncbi:hypothetical protein HYG93_03845 [Acinetobacter sp. SwsAc6]|uniref:hypothetical protein n=1 Tax=Acinetobacter TaxID=469 RepID=UPI000EA30BBC|nr:MULTISPECIES: hypothetical protein [Acinetobacter]NWK73427.1 hypothetical protein [Acinetobacter sp. SwsAc6]RKG51937.1 hypothetical protein D7V68_01065 [Acinetobacter cumulans]